MVYTEFEDIISQDRMRRYLTACNLNTRKAMTLYRYNIRLSQELLAVVGCFEVALRNKINRHFVANDGNDWLRDLILPGGKFYSDKRVEKTKRIIKKAYEGLLDPILIVTINFFPKWSLAYGSICFQMFNIILQDKVYYLFFPRSLSPPEFNVLIIPISSKSLTI